MTVTLNRPERKNAVPAWLWQQLHAVFSEISRRPDDRVMVLTGAGGDFCSGADLGGGDASGSHPLSSMHDVADAALTLHRMPKPTIARVDGVAVGAGMNLALSMSKALLNKSFETSMDQALEAESQAQAVNLTGPDVEEAFKAFLEKREPKFA